jgi:GH43 family beta-xylosidase
VTPRTYTNPVYAENFPDPFVLRYHGRYYAFGTGPAGDGRLFPMLSSLDLVEWREHVGALEPLDLEGAEEYWAPEVAYAEGTFYMYYATGRTADPDHHLRLATAPHPLGPWRDAGLNLSPHEIFAIDAHPFRDPRDGQWYLFYARDVLEGPFAGTGVAVDRLLAMDRLEGKPRDVLRPHSEWQVFELQRAVKGGLDWYTVEGPFVLLHGHRYICLYSGGRWERPEYGVGYGTAEHPLGPWTDDANREGPVVLRTVPERVLGPGHNSVITGPDLVTPYVVYHAWDPEFRARSLRIDPLTWENGRPRCEGPSLEPRPAPPTSDLLFLFDEQEPGPEWERRGDWARDRDGLWIRGDGASLTWPEAAADLVLEVDLEQAGASVALGEVRVSVDDETLRAGGTEAPLPEGFRHEAWHRLRVEARGRNLVASLDEYPTIETEIPSRDRRVVLTGRSGCRFSHLALKRL